MFLKENGDDCGLLDRLKDVSMTYADTKKAAKQFQEAKIQLFTAFKKAGLGDWVKKPMEQDEFH